MTRQQPNFDTIARPYRWLEYLTFGRLLERTRFFQLPHLRDAKSALILGDGDGRFLAQLLAIHPNLHADVIDISEAMLRLARARIPPAADVHFQQADIRNWQPSAGRSYDLVVTHFFLDCLSEQQIVQLIKHLLPALSSQTTWIVSEFAIPAGRVSQPAGYLLVRVLYLAFRLLTGLRVQSLPRYAPLLEQTGFVCDDATLVLGGILRSERWRRIS